MTETDRREAFLAALRELGGSAGNARLREKLGWIDDTYDQIKQALIADGQIVPGRGRGGSVTIASESNAASPPQSTASKAQLRKPANNTSTKGNRNGGDLGFEAEMFKAADKLRGNMEPSDYKHVALGLIFLKHISDSFEARHAELLEEYPEEAEDPDSYLAENIFWVPKEARWSNLRANARQPGIGKLIDEAMLAIEKVNPSLKGVLPKEYARPALNAVMLGELIDLISGIALGESRVRARDVLGRVYEYMLGQFAGSEGKRGGEFYTPRSVVRLLVEILRPFPNLARGIKGRVYDPCCGSGGMFVQAERFLETHGGRLGELAIYGQESNYTTWRLCKMNLAVRGIDADIRWNNEGSFHKDELPDLGPTSSWPIRRSTSPTGAAIGCATMSGGNTACHPRATPTSHGSSTSSTI
jgi:type I restriction enzyme M protein